MTRPYPWTDGYVVAVADQILWNYQVIWPRFTAHNPDLSLQRIRDLLGTIRAAGNPISDDMAPHLPKGEDVANTVDELYQYVVGIREVGAQIFTGPADLPEYLFCTCAFPREYRGLPGPDLVSPDEVELLHMGDMPAHVQDWKQRRQIEQFSRLRHLTLFHSPLSHEPLGIALEKLPLLQGLDLRESGLTYLPDPILQCSQLTFLMLNDNPLVQLPDLTGLPKLRYLGLARTGLSRRQVAHMRTQLPHCEIADASHKPA
ncbi:leucine-rich repeat domain-containing protein [Candidatus Chloroploca sp. Khr17]|uniref:leucine-rich repeat domain-containing protein n=1 Tax=Candidatus Chloroploca sp. Khr17 TaxID=2496869 RepID=UPI00101C1372|nr:leucine-rich repeat domain-containing protein [Candidatus Chloroploca sp. Khr17]